MGFSQGAWIAHQAGPGGEAVVLLASGVDVGLIPLRCNNAEATGARPVLAIPGESDGVYTGDAAEQLAKISGIECPGARQCWDKDTGWVLALNSEVSDGTADHAFPFFRGGLEPQWLRGHHGWARHAIVEWIERHASP